MASRGQPTIPEPGYRMLANKIASLEQSVDDLRRMNRPMCRLLRTSGQLLASGLGAPVDVAFQTAGGVNDEEMWTTPATRITVPKAGWYLCHANCLWPNGGTGDLRLFRIHSSATGAGAVTGDERPPSPTSSLCMSISGVTLLDVGGEVWCAAFHNSGSSMTIGVGSNGVDPFPLSLTVTYLRGTS